MVQFFALEVVAYFLESTSPGIFVESTSVVHPWNIFGEYVQHWNMFGEYVHPWNVKELPNICDKKARPSQTFSR